MLDDPSDRSLFTAARRLADHLRLRYRSAMVERGFTWHRSASGDLLALIPESGISQSALTAAAGLTKQAVQQLLDQLETHGVILRQTDAADRRIRHVVLTELGHRDAAARREVLASLEADIRTALGGKLHKKLRKAMRSLAKS